MKKKGFTLIELLAAIIIISIMLVVAIPRILNAIETAKINTYKNGNKILTKAADTYLMDNIGLAPTQIGDSVEITVNDLVTAKYLKPIVDPKDKSDTCNGYVLVTKLSDSGFDYTPNLKCGSSNTVTNSTQDGLVLYQKFDGFNEPTTNLVMDSGVINWTVGVLGAGTITRTVITANDKYKITSDAAVTALRFYVPVAKLTSGLSYNLSYKYKIIKGTTFSMSDWCDQTLYNKVDNTYKKYSYSSAYGTRTTYDSTFRFMDIFISANTEVEIWDVQLEQRTFATDFTSSIRNATVYDSSISSNDGDLVSATSPAYVENSRNGTGAYNFNGINNYIDLGVSKSGTSIGIGNEMTIMAWVKFGSVADATRVGNIIGNYGNAAPNFNFEGYTSGRVRLWWNGGEIDNLVQMDLRGEWHHIAVTRKVSENKSVIYIDGVEKLILISGANVDIKWPLRIGNDFRAGVGIPFNGLIDDVRVYNRALTLEEIKFNYDLNK